MPTDALTIVIGNPMPEQFRRQLEEAHPDVQFVYCEPGELAGHLSDADVVIGWGFTSEQIKQASRLKWIQTISAGVDRIDPEPLKARDIILTNSSGVHAVNIPEHILGLMFSFARQLPRLHDQQKERVWKPETVRGDLFELTGQTLFVAGLGKIGEGLARRAKGLEMRVIAMRRRIEIERESAADEVIGFDQLTSRIGEADHVAITLPLTPGTRGMFSAEVLAAMKDGAYIYNIGRGPIIDQDALIRELESGRLGGAGLDVTTPEPLPAESPLWSLPNVIITPHSSGWSPKNLERGVPIWTENIRRFRAGEPLLNVVDIDAGY